MMSSLESIRDEGEGSPEEGKEERRMKGEMDRGTREGHKSVKTGVSGGWVVQIQNREVLSSKFLNN